MGNLVLVFAKPIIGAAIVEEAAAVGLDRLALRVIPDFARSERSLHDVAVAKLY
jgi:hypothetical protein